MNDLVLRITSAIFRQEGGALTVRNPGNLRDCPWFSYKSFSLAELETSGVIGQRERVYPDGQMVEYQAGFWLPRTRAEGVAGAIHCVALRIAEGQSLAQLITGWAPPDENKTADYIANVKAWAGIPDETVPLWNFIE